MTWQFDWSDNQWHMHFTGFGYLALPVFEAVDRLHCPSRLCVDVFPTPDSSQHKHENNRSGSFYIPTGEESPRYRTDGIVL